MNINSIQQGSASPAFGAAIVKTIPVKQFLNTMKMKNNAAENTRLWNQIENAVSNHPSDKFIFTETGYLYGQKNSIIGMLKTSAAEMFTNKKAEKSSYDAVFNVWKEILNPENKEAFNNLFGEKYSTQYKAWWEENVAPIWDKLSKIR